jgi:integrase
MKGTSVKANRSRDYFVTREEADAVTAACPDNQWKLLFALSRYGGLRCPSEHLALLWGDVNWDAETITVRSPKTAHVDGREERLMPLFPELREPLEAARDEFLEHFDPKADRLSEQPIISRYRDTNSNLRTQLNRIIRKAGLKPWPKLFQNLRATRATELAMEHPGHVAAAWLGHSNTIADVHYRQVTSEHHARAVRAAQTLQQPTATAATESNECSADDEKSLDVRISAGLAAELVTPTGLEPVLPA